jgi:hypothetical protein
MTIAVIGWGSLIWCPGSLRLKSRWRCDGPKLPIEFGRISSGDRLTLILVKGVLVKGVKEQKTLWALSDCANVKDACQNLADREMTSPNNVSSWETRQGIPGKGPGKTIAQWCFEKGLDSAIWTSLSSKDRNNNNRLMSSDEVIAYLRSLKDSKRAEEYIRNTPSQIDTAYRQRIRAELGWTDNRLPEWLFES